jgi:hypothetical protein
LAAAAAELTEQWVKTVAAVVEMEQTFISQTEPHSIAIWLRLELLDKETLAALAALVAQEVEARKLPGQQVRLITIAMAAMVAMDKLIR